ncbi:MAG: zinc-binding dehydrogenase [Gammaproteobacteria bacterium]
MKQIRLYGPDDLRLDEMPDPAPGPADVVVKVAAFGICGSDLHFKKRGGVAGPVKAPCGIGHEFVGTIHAVGGEVRGIAPGARVVVDPIEHGHSIGIGADEGAYGQYVLVRDAKLGGPIHALPDAVSMQRAVLVEPVAVATHAINRGEFPAGGRAVVFGTGPIGLAAIAVLKYRGASKILAVDVIDERLERARRLGAHETVNARGRDMRATMMQVFGRVKDRGRVAANCDLFLDAAGAPGILNDIVNVARFRDGSRIVIVAVPEKPELLDIGQILGRELTIRGSVCYPDEFPQVISMMADPRFDIEPMVSHTFDFAEFDRAFATAEDPRQSAKVVVRMS